MNAQQRERSLQLRVGIFLVIALVLFLGMVYALGARARLFERHVKIHADFTEVGGLAEGATVRLAGVQIGRVTGVHLPTEPGGKVRVDLSIARQYADRVRDDSVARIETQGLLGDKIVEITVGSAKAAAVRENTIIAARDPTDITRIMDEGASTVKSVAALAESLRETAESFGQGRITQDLSATLSSTRSLTARLDRLAGQVEQGRGWAHALLYDEPVALHRLDGIIAQAQAILDRVQTGQSAVGVLTSPESADAARRLVSLMDRIGRLGEGRVEDQGVLPTLLFDPRYRGVLDDLGVTARNLRQLSDRLAGGHGLLGKLTTDDSSDGGFQKTRADLDATLANLRSITEKLNEGEGTLGALLADPTVYERLVGILDGAQRSFLLRHLLRGLGKSGERAEPPRR
jgi:phospholipid/cholesterol/gamma-HCH transport system substrate-binding protein